MTEQDCRFGVRARAYKRYSSHQPNVQELKQHHNIATAHACTTCARNIATTHRLFILDLVEPFVLLFEYCDLLLRSSKCLGYVGKFCTKSNNFLLQLSVGSPKFGPYILFNLGHHLFLLWT